jgi:hypothetical protein
MHTVTQEIFNQIVPSFLRDLEFSLAYLLESIVFFSQIIDIERVKFTQQLFVNVDILSICVSDKDTLTQMFLKGMDLLDFGAFGTTGPSTKQTQLIVCHTLLA